MAIEGIGTVQALRKERRQKNPLLVINCAVTAYNYRHIEEMLDIAHEIGADALNYQHQWALTHKMADAHNHRYGDVHPVSIEEIGGVGFAIELDSPIQSLTYYGSGGRSVTRTNVGTLRFSLGGLFKDQIPGAKNYIVPINSNLYKGLWNYFMLEADKSKGAHNPSFIMRVLAVTKAMLSQ